MGATLASIFTTPAGVSWLVVCSLEAAVLLAASWLGAALLRRGTAAARHQLWTLGVIGALLLPLLGWALPSLAPSLPSLAPSMSVSADAATVADAPAIVVTAGGATEAAPSWPVWVALAWAAGAALVASRWLRGTLAARRLVRAATPAVAASWSVARREAAASLALAAEVPLLRSDAIDSPMTVGVLRPRVLLPAAAEGWSAGRLRAVLLHELGHVRRRDPAIQLAAQVACALHWWNPLVWIAAARLRVEREHACDDLVLGAGVLPSSYAADLLAVARSMSRDAHAGAIGMAERSRTEERLVRVLDPSAPRRPVRARFRLATSALALAGTVMFACTSSPPRPAPADVAAAPAPAAVMATPAAVSVGAPFVSDWLAYHPPAFQGAIDLSGVAAEVRGRLGGLEQCYQRRLAAAPALAGTVVVHAYITEAGTVADACVTTDTVADRELTECVNKLVVETRFPASRAGSVDVSFPFVFASRKT